MLKRGALLLQLISDKAPPAAPDRSEVACADVIILTPETVGSIGFSAVAYLKMTALKLAL